MKKMLLKILILAIAVFASSYYVPGISVENFLAALFVALAVILTNIFIKPIVKLICLPINLMTLGLFSFVINIGLMYAVVYFVPGITAVGFLPTLEISTGLAILSVILNLFL